MKTKAFKVIALLVILAPPLFGEVLSFPPVRPMRSFGDWALFPEVGGWVTGKRHLSTGSSLNHSWDYELGVDLRVFQGPFLAGYVKGRMLLLSEVHPLNPDYIHPLMVVPGFYFGLEGKVGSLIPYAEFIHDCKHNTDRPGSRIAVHDIIGFGASHLPLEWSYGETGLSGALTAAVGLEISLPAVFQPHDLEINALAFSASVYAEPLRWEPWLSLFANIQWKGFIRKDNPFFANVGEFDFDFVFQGGVAFPDPDNGVSLYFQWERLTDNLIDFELETEHLPSIGLLVRLAST